MSSNASCSFVLLCVMKMIAVPAGYTLEYPYHEHRTQLFYARINSRVALENLFLVLIRLFVAMFNELFMLNRRKHFHRSQEISRTYDCNHFKCIKFVDIL